MTPARNLWQFGLIVATLLSGCQFSSSDYQPPGPGNAPPPAGPEIVDVAAGYQHTCALRFDGTVRCWGANHWGQLGSGPSTGLTEPRDVPGLNNVVDLSSQGDTTCALLDDATVRCWGPNDRGQLGQQNTTTYFAPVAVEGLTDAVQMEVGSTTSCALRSDGTVWCWGGQQREVSGMFRYDLSEIAPVVDASDMIQISLAGQHGCGVRSDATLWCWNEHDFPRRVPYLHPDLEGVQRVADGGYQTCVLFGDQTFAWLDIYNPVQPEYLEMSDPRRFEQPNQIVDLCIGGYHTCLLRAGGTVHCFGSNSSGAAGNGTREYASVDSEVSDITDAVALNCGTNHNCAVHSSGAVSCWGRNEKGALGDGTTTDRLKPVWVTQR